MILGVNGMLGHTIYKYFVYKKALKIVGILRNRRKIKSIPSFYESRNIFEFNLFDESIMKNIIYEFRPKNIVNCIGIVKQHPDSNDPLVSIPVNSLFPHKLNQICKLINCRLIQISTDCVFSGNSGFYRESDSPDAVDLYGRSKLLGEVKSDNSVTLRTSFFGEELGTQRGLLSWFLSQNQSIKGFSKAIYSGLTTLELARAIDKFVIPDQNLKGLYHLSSNPIDKFSLLNIFNNVYGKNIYIEKDTKYETNRSLDSTKFRKITGYEPIEWSESIKIMREFGSLPYV